MWYYELNTIKRLTCDSGYILSDINSTNIHSAPPVKKYNNDRNRASPLNTKKKKSRKRTNKKKKKWHFSLFLIFRI